MFGRAAPSYDTVGPRFFSHFGKRLVELAQVSPGARVLDVATGRGALLLPAVEAVGSQGHIIGIDLADGMVAAMIEDVSRRGFKNVEIHKMDAENLDFPDASFDIVMCGFALFMFPNLKRAMSEFLRVLVPGGRLAVSTWGKDDERWSWLGELSQKYAPPQIKAMREAQAKQPPSPYPLNKSEGLQALMTSVGLVNIEVIEDGPEVTYADEDEWVEVQLSHGGRMYFDMLPAEQWELYKKDAFEHLRVMKTDHGIPHALYVLYTLADKPKSG